MLFDNDYSHEPKLRELPLRLENLARLPLLFLIRLYQRVVSPSLPPNSCRYYPSCSHYGYQAIYKHGAFKGTTLTIRRIIRCNPWSEGGVDPVP